MSKMKNKQLAQISILLLVVMFCLMPHIIFAQPCLPDDPDHSGPCPIDGGISLLLAAGVGYGVKRYRDARKKDKAATV
jgi:hypothetical protein